MKNKNLLEQSLLRRTQTITVFQTYPNENFCGIFWIAYLYLDFLCRLGMIPLALTLHFNCFTNTALAVSLELGLDLA